MGINKLRDNACIYKIYAYLRISITNKVIENLLYIITTYYAQVTCKWNKIIGADHLIEKILHTYISTLVIYTYIWRV